MTNLLNSMKGQIVEIQFINAFSTVQTVEILDVGEGVIMGEVVGSVFTAFYSTCTITGVVPN